MVTIQIVQNDRFLQIEGLSPTEKFSVRKHFTKRVNNWYQIKQKNRFAQIEEAFITDQFIIPIGLWKEMVHAFDENGIHYEISDELENLLINNIDRDEFEEYVMNLFDDAEENGKPFIPQYHQIEAAYQMIRYRNNNIEVSTSGGKTLISYIVFKYLYEVYGISRFVLFTPNTDLTKQTLEKFIHYDTNVINVKGKDWTAMCVYSGAPKYNEPDPPTIIFGNYQSLTKRPFEFFKDIQCVIGDEIQHITAKSVRSILTKCGYAEYKMGMTGTFFPGGSYNDFLAQAFIGPIVYRITSDELINQDRFATPVVVIARELQYKDKDLLRKLYKMRKNKPKGDFQASAMIYNFEREIVRYSEARFNIIVDDISKVKKNTLVLFADIKTGYGKRVYKYLKETTDKEVFYIDGGVDSKIREQYIQMMEDDTSENTIIVASFGTFSEGIDIKRLWNIFLIETVKSERIVAQILGRGMRNLEGKTHTILFDYRDNMNWDNTSFSWHKECYMMRHAKARDSIYKKRNFPAYKQEFQIFTSAEELENHKATVELNEMANQFDKMVTGAPYNIDENMKQNKTI